MATTWSKLAAEKDITTPGDLYDEIVKVTTSAERDHHYSDLYIKDSPAVRDVLYRYKYFSAVTTFRDQTDPRRALWYEIPFAYLPYWQGQRD